MSGNRSGVAWHGDKNSQDNENGSSSKVGCFVALFLVFVIIIAGIVMAVPGSRVWCLGEVAGTGAQALGPDELGAVLTDALDNLDSDTVAEIINDDENRESLVNFIKDLLPRLEADDVATMIHEMAKGEFIVDLLPALDANALSDLINTMLADEESSAFVTDLIPLLDADSLAQLVNKIVASEGTANLVNDLISNLDAEGLAVLVNDIVAAPGTTELVDGLVSNLGAEGLASLVNNIIALENTTEFVKQLRSNLYLIGAGDNLAKLVNALVANPDIEPFLTDIIGKLDGEGLGDLLSPFMANQVTLDHDLLNELGGIDGGLGALISGLNGTDEDHGALPDELYPYLWVHVDVDGIKALSEIPPWLQELIDGLDLMVWIRLHDLLWGVEDPYRLTEDYEV